MGIKKIVFGAVASFVVTIGFSQRSPSLFISADFAPLSSKFPSAGIGASVGMDFGLSRKWSLPVNGSYLHYKGNIINPFIRDTIDKINLLSFLAGPRYHLTRRLSAGCDFGVVTGLNKKIATVAAIAPAAEITIYRNISIGLKWIIVPGLPSFSENNFLQKGGYDMGEIRMQFNIP